MVHGDRHCCMACMGGVEGKHAKPPDLLFVMPYSPETQEHQEDRWEDKSMEYVFSYNSYNLASAHRTGKEALSIVGNLRHLAKNIYLYFTLLATGAACSRLPMRFARCAHACEGGSERIRRYESERARSATLRVWVWGVRDLLTKKHLIGR